MKNQQELLIKKYNLRKRNGCFNINKALELEAKLDKDTEEFKILQELLN